MSLNAISYNAVIRALEIIRDGKTPIYKSTVIQKSKEKLNVKNEVMNLLDTKVIFF